MSPRVRGTSSPGLPDSPPAATGMEAMGTTAHDTAKTNTDNHQQDAISPTPNRWRLISTSAGQAPS